MSSLPESNGCGLVEHLPKQRWYVLALPNSRLPKLYMVKPIIPLLDLSSTKAFGAMGLALTLILGAFDV